MSECFSKYFLYNDNIEQCNKFDENLLVTGKSLYEVIRIINGKPLFLERHLNRLTNSEKITNLRLWLGENELKERIRSLIKANNFTEGNIKLIFNFNTDNVFLAYFVKHHYPEKEKYEKGVPTILYHGERNNPNAKVINSNFRVAVDKEIKDKGAFEAILVDRNGYITEGSKSNIFMIKDEKVITAPIEGVLPGVTREVIIEVCKNMGIKVQEEKVHYNDLKDLDALFISGTSPKVLPISCVNDIEFNSAKNETVIKIMNAYNEAVKNNIE
ncbi:aminotransferase class IV [Clostridium sp. DJ247]|uniref:aminotransferase class IV n=1 Tax=Clostridium sp. DJ247 TaxID=2726188 RepID=UPI0016231C5F|nr:aminotransferase class IV [Clostridium sp. DJ247]MBC2581607.1 aminotransferase class IV [Clostridium sp. DJ247]